MRYECQYIADEKIRIPWDKITPERLYDVVTGATPRLETQFRACWTEEALHVRFECEDDHTVATMERRDDPIYEEDVVEVFLDPMGTGKVYYEFELSPRGVEFDALIHNNLDGNKKVDVAWDAKGLRTSVSDGAEGWKHYELRIPFADLREGQEQAQVPRHGAEWGWNVYRIDDDTEGTRHYWAWSPTGAVNFHIPQRFGTLVFVKK
ncbi:carbohydrate-binding family 9-like protein [Paenibacillus sp. CGMCC 1.16610]|uniref:Carbohydrate-binding domain-containing protein n=1 Tax=Paenibacillus anseongense TaxID=2682845 RepID=A0ABW9UCP9_9BACL|nr:MULTISPECIES: carbohydrate-binding family 9-like protein [Paenibacillus]MBA2943995.1 carbohydrate-binding family 9-like protein [Paenibacillus sp. CGMCC 1.16610]MVQ37884.1 hypothetical protein [Paenibacillus anseongense]